MKYELAKKLKDAGFPEDKVGIWMTSDDSFPHIIPNNLKNGDIIKMNPKKEAVFIPNLSVLLEWR